MVPQGTAFIGIFIQSTCLTPFLLAVRISLGIGRPNLTIDISSATNYN